MQLVLLVSFDGGKFPGEGFREQILFLFIGADGSDGKSSMMILCLRVSLETKQTIMVSVMRDINIYGLENGLSLLMNYLPKIAK